MRSKASPALAAAPELADDAARPARVAETAHPYRFCDKKETLKLIVDDAGYTRIDEKRGKPVNVCFCPKRDES